MIAPQPARQLIIPAQVGQGGTVSFSHSNNLSSSSVQGLSNNVVRLQGPSGQIMQAVITPVVSRGFRPRSNCSIFVWKRSKTYPFFWPCIHIALLWKWSFSKTLMKTYTKFENGAFWKRQKWKHLKTLHIPLLIGWWLQWHSLWGKSWLVPSWQLLTKALYWKGDRQHRFAGAVWTPIVFIAYSFKNRTMWAGSVFINKNG